MPPKRRDLTPEEVSQVERLAAVLTMEQVADFLGISDRTLRKRMSENDEVRAAYKRGKQRAIAGVATSLLQKANSGNIAAMIFYLKTQAGWRETQRIEHAGDMSSLSDAELEAIARGDVTG